jgi:hypothetical protein
MQNKGKQPGGGVLLQADNNLILFPKTVAFYREQLGRLLEREQFGQAIRILEHLAEAGIGDEAALEEWQSLLAFLRTMFPDGLPPTDEEEDDLSEESLLEAHVLAKNEHDIQYTAQLLELFANRMELAKQIDALDQLRYARHPGIGPVIRKWLKTQPLPAGIQLKALQLLKHHGEQGSVTLPKRGRTYVIDIQDVPASASDYPMALLAIAERVQETVAAIQPELLSFAEETWREFLAFAYGTPVYVRLVKLDDEQIDVWAAALHLTLLTIVHGEAEEANIREAYGITSQLARYWQKACDELRLFVHQGLPYRTM